LALLNLIRFLSAQLSSLFPTITTPALRLALHKCARKNVGNIHLLPMPSPQQAIIASHKLIRTEPLECCMPGCKLGGSSACPVGYEQLSAAALGKPSLGDQLAPGLGLSHFSAGFIVVQLPSSLNNGCQPGVDNSSKTSQVLG